MMHEFDYCDEKVTITAPTVDALLVYLRALKPDSFRRVA